MTEEATDPDPDPDSGCRGREPPPRVPVALEQAVGAAAMAAICLITFANVVVRYLTDFSFAFTEEYSVFLLVVMTFAGAAGAFATNGHIRVEVLTGRLPPPIIRRMELAIMALAAGLFGVLAWYGAYMAWDDWRYEVTSPGLGVPQWLYTAALPVLAVVVMARIGGRVLRLLARSEPRP